MVVFFEETLVVAVFLTVGLEATFPLGFLDVTVFLGLSALEAVRLEFSATGFLTAFAVVFLGFSLVEDGFLMVAEVIFLAKAGFLF